MKWGYTILICFKNSQGSQYSFHNSNSSITFVKNKKEDFFATMIVLKEKRPGVVKELEEITVFAPA